MILGVCVLIMVLGFPGFPSEPEEKASWALGLDLPDIDSISLWKVGQDRAWGVSLWATSSFSTKQDRVSVRSSFTLKRFRQWRRGVTMFTFGQALGSFSYWESPEDIGAYWVGIAGGIGVAWMPLERVGIFVSEGIKVLRRDDDVRSSRRDSEWFTSLASPDVVAFWMF